MNRRDSYANKRKLSFLGFNTRGGDGITNPDEVQLDTEMEKVFAGVDTTEKFDLAKLVEKSNPTAAADNITNQGPSTDSKYDETEFCSHRSAAYPQPHSAFNIHSGIRSPDTVSPTETPVTTPESTTEPSSPTVPLSIISSSTDDPQVSQRSTTGGYGGQSDTSSDVKHVAFNKNERRESIQTNDSLGDDSEIQKKRRKGRHFQKPRKYSLQEYGSFKNGGTDRRISVQPEDEHLEEADIDDLTSHRSDDPRGGRRHRIHSNVSHMHQNGTQMNMGKKSIDHSPHEVFVQLDELMGTGEEREWKETARWIKYEEDLEEGADRWGRPHVAPLSFHSLLNLRRCLETGVVLLDLDEKDVASVAYRIVEQMCIDELICEEDKPTVMRSLLLKHRHVNEHSHGSFHFGAKRKYSSYTSLQSLWGDDGIGRRCSVCSSTHSRSLSPLPPLFHPANIHNVTRPSRRHSAFPHFCNINDDKRSKIPSISEGGHDTSTIDMKEETYSTTSQEDLKKLAMNDTIFKRIPQGAEATTVLVGAVDFLEQPTIAFVRLAEGIQMPSITEVPVPVRFLFILLGPKSADLDYHEVGRSIATLMSSAHFHNIAYKAEDRKELLSAINEFLDDSIVLPPGDWENPTILPFDEIKAKKDMIRLRKKKALEAKNKINHTIIDDEKKLLASSGDDDGPKKPSKNPLERTRRPWGGLINDIKRRYPMYKSDILDGLNTETLAATIFMYFAALSTAITFGGLASDKTYNLIGISETLISCSFVGICFHLLSGQPLVIIGTTGPLLLFDEALYEFCRNNEDINFLIVRVYIGIWLVVIALVVSAFEGSVLVRLFTRFTQEIFSALITLIYIVETIMKLILIFGRHPLLWDYIYKPEEPFEPYSAALTATTTESFNGTMLGDSTINTLARTATKTSEVVVDLINLPKSNGSIENLVSNISQKLLSPSDQFGPINRPNTALFCLILTLGTFTLAYYLKLFRNSHFLGRNARRALGDFGVPISIAIFVLLDFMLPQVFTEKLTVPVGLSPSDPDSRGWFIKLEPIEVWIPFVCCVPAMLVYILIFMETHISELIVDKPERGLKKGSGLHMDIVLLCFLNMICGFFGMPWHCAATVRSVTHVSAVTIMSRTHAPGDKPHIADVKEQRISGFVVSLMVGLSVAMAPVLREIPMSVLFGVFLYMGIASMSGVHLFERIRLLFMPVKHHPSAVFVRRVPTWKMHLFTLVQVFALAVLWTVKSSRFSLAFPFFLILMVPLRMQIGRFFTETELKSLDGSQADPDAEDEPDFYAQASIPA